MKIVYLFILLFALIVSLFHIINAQSYIETYLQKRRTNNEILRVYYENKYCGQTWQDMPCKKY